MKLQTKHDLELVSRHGGYRPEILEKVYVLIDLLRDLMSVEVLNESLVLKGGTAMNIFCTDTLPRLSVDLDFNYIRSLSRDEMLLDRKRIEESLFRMYVEKRDMTLVGM